MLQPAPVAGFVLAGGKSSRMGRDKALIELAGKPLLAHAVAKLRRICSEVAILGADAGFAPYGPLVPDLHPHCGPMSGVEAALAHADCDWSLLLPVDVPFVPGALLAFWAAATVEHGRSLGTRLALFTVEEKPQPALMMVHRDLLPSVSAAIARGEHKLLPMLEGAAQASAQANATLQGPRLGRILWEAERQFDNSYGQPGDEPWRVLTPAQQRGRALWFANLNTPADLAMAEQNLDLLDT